jgi:predicted dienelactone hydrolase
LEDEMKILHLIIAVALSLTAGAAAARTAVGFERISVPDPQGPPLSVDVWYPTAAAPSLQRLDLDTQTVATGAPVSGRRLPLIVVSHGAGGSSTGHYDTALALAGAGFVVAAMNHTGDNYRDQSRAVFLAERPRHIHLLIDYMLGAWRGSAQIAPDRIGAFGHSAGGFTVLVAAGGVPDFSGMAAHCAAHPDYFDCGVLKRGGTAADRILPATLSWTWTHDARIKAVVAAAPALGFTLTKAGLAGVTVPVQLWRAEDDRILPHPDYAEAVRRALPAEPDYHVVAHAGHFDFLAPCSDAMAHAAAMICQSEPGFSRQAFHGEFNRDVVAFFEANLPRH